MARAYWDSVNKKVTMTRPDNHPFAEDPLQGYVLPEEREAVKEALYYATGSNEIANSEAAQNSWLMGLTRGQRIPEVLNDIQNMDYENSLRGSTTIIDGNLVRASDYLGFANAGTNNAGTNNAGTNNAGTNNAGTNNAGTNNAGTAGSGNTNFGYGTSGVVYGPDGRSYSSAAAAIAAGETNYTFAPPTQGLIMNQLLNNRRT